MSTSKGAIPAWPAPRLCSTAPGMDVATSKPVHGGNRQPALIPTVPSGIFATPSVSVFRGEITPEQRKLAFLEIESDLADNILARIDTLLRHR